MAHTADSGRFGEALVAFALNVGAGGARDSAENARRSLDERRQALRDIDAVCARLAPAASAPLMPSPLGRAAMVAAA